MEELDKNPIQQPMQITKSILIKCLKAVSNSNVEELLFNLEKAVIHLRNNYEFQVTEVHRPGPCKIEKVFGKIEVTEEGWVHITLNILLPHCKYSGTQYITDSINNLLRSINCPKYKEVFVAIVEYCNYKTAKVFDSDNKSWKSIINALKGRVMGDDNQFNCHIGLFAKISDKSECNIYVMPFKDVSIFTENLYSSL